MMEMAADDVNASRAAEEDSTAKLEQILFQEKSVWFYRVPAGQVSTLSPRADSWDPEHPFMTGSLQIVQKDDDCFVVLYEPLAADVDFSTPPTLFAQCPVEVTKELALDVYVQDCADSSRYFMIRVEDEATKRRAYIGIGFPERSSAFNFKASLQDYVKYRLRQMEAAALTAGGVTEGTSDGTAAAEGSPITKTRDLKLPEGATIRINLKTGNESSDRPAVERRRSSGDGTGEPVKVPLIPPPPPAPEAGQPPSTAKAPVAAADVSEDDWGDFTSA
ncbi:TPA: hypothetical protein N0F65_009700 [Lagenidium giganteum]|uniref:NECAP PHear domain-containing protein n=1 Tax=Lagenidium giganteum TaxID=4803 RepID=A0AAV2YJA7_9STRA|nr:TPA: hypothetical protein N0F65_009700 [Lagenidium giganteum]